MDNDGKKNEGEGNRTAARRYNEKTENFIESADVESKAQKARESLDSEEGESLTQAEKRAREGKSD